MSVEISGRKRSRFLETLRRRGSGLADSLNETSVVRYSAEGFPDDTDRNGPTVISTTTLQAVSDWFPGIDLEESRRRFRTSLELGGVSAFWEDRLFGVHEGDAVRFTVGDVNVEGTNPCPRCTVPARDSLRGSDMIGFQKRFSDLRRTHYPSWACQPDRIDNFYHLAITRAWRRLNMRKCCGWVIRFRCADAAMSGLYNQLVVLR